MSFKVIYALLISILGITPSVSASDLSSILRDEMYKRATEDIKARKIEEIIYKLNSGRLEVRDIQRIQNILNSKKKKAKSKTGTECWG